MEVKKMFEAVMEMAPTLSANGLEAAALWRCDHCQVWWGSQDGRQKEARLLLRMAEPNSNLFGWDAYRGWRVKRAEANICPDCGQRAQFPRLTLLSPAAAVKSGEGAQER
jgi:hypothetical protein